MNPNYIHITGLTVGLLFCVISFYLHTILYTPILLGLTIQIYSLTINKNNYANFKKKKEYKI